MDGSKEEKIRNRAYELWEQSGKPEGSDGFLVQAERESEGKFPAGAPTTVADDPE